MAPSLKFKLSHEMIRYTLVLKKKIFFSLLPPTLVEIGPVVLEKKTKMWKVYDNANDNANAYDVNDWQRTNFDQKSSLEPSAQVS